MPSEEMLRKLLDEFVEKEALMLEELKVVGEQIEQLEERLIGCKERLGTIGADRQKIIGMQQRYVEGNFDSPPMANYNGSESVIASSDSASNGSPTTSSASGSAALASGSAALASGSASSTSGSASSTSGSASSASGSEAASTSVPAASTSDSTPSSAGSSSSPASGSSAKKTGGISAILGQRAKSTGSVPSAPTINAPTPHAAAAPSSQPAEITPSAEWTSESTASNAAQQPAEPSDASARAIDYSHEHVPTVDYDQHATTPSAAPKPDYTSVQQAHQEVAPANEDAPIDLDAAQQEPQEDDTVKSINDALRSLFR